MQPLQLRGLITRIQRSYKEIFSKNVVVLRLAIAACVLALAACGSAVTAQAGHMTSIPTPVLSPTPIAKSAHSPSAKPTHLPVPTPTPKPTVVPQPTTVPSTMAPPPILDLRPASMSIVGHLDCQKTSAFVCFARVLSEPANQGDLHWVAFTNVPGHIVFSPASGVLSAGQSTLVTITVPFNACTPGLFFFRGPINTHTITWSC